MNDVVQKLNCVKASEDDLRATVISDPSVAAAPTNNAAAKQTPVTSNASSDPIVAVTPKSSVGAEQLPPTGGSGTITIHTTDGQNTISQEVTWEAKFVDKISEITDSMNISGNDVLSGPLLTPADLRVTESLDIKVDAIGGGGEAKGHFLDTNKFKESDLNYHIQVKVTNQKLVAGDVT